MNFQKKLDKAEGQEHKILALCRNLELDVETIVNYRTTLEEVMFMHENKPIWEEVNKTIDVLDEIIISYRNIEHDISRSDPKKSEIETRQSMIINKLVHVASTFNYALPKILMIQLN